MYKPESTLENKTNKILCDFEIQTVHLISARRPVLVIVNKKRKKKKRKKEKLENLANSWFCSPCRLQNNVNTWKER